MFRSLQAQIIIVLGALVTVLCVQIFMTRQSQSLLVNNQQRNFDGIADIELVHELERDVVDLQRNVLIYKGSASVSSITRFNDLLESVTEKLYILSDEKKMSEDENKLSKDLVESMFTHLKAYQENFSSVIQGRQQRSEIFEDELQKDFQYIVQYLKDLHTNDQKIMKDLLIIKFHIAQAQSHSYQYLISPEFEHIENFMGDINSVKKRLEKYDQLKDGLSVALRIEKNFNKLTQVTRGYVFLVNVVMTGSANEFLYLTKELRTYVTDRQHLLNEHSKLIAKENEIRGNFAAILSAVLGIFILVFLTVRVIRPIRSITRIFNILAQGGELDEIPGIGRDDEIGLLARAANVFHKKNKQTNSLLADTQKMNATHQQLNKELSEEKYKAEQAVLSKSMFLANMSHEIRTPMNGIIGLVELTLKTDVTEKQRDYLNKISYSGDIMMGVINDILDFSKIEAGKLEIEHAEFDINAMIENLISVMYLRIDEKLLNFRVNLKRNMPTILVGDSLRINQILLNLCNNAVKFTEQGVITVEIDFESSPEKGHGLLTFSVCDSGIGMSCEQTEKIFDSFTQADGSTSRKFGGTGLGLAIVKQLAELMQGSVRVESEVGVGSTFIVSLDVELTDSNLLFESNELDDNLLHYWHTQNEEILSKDYLNSCEIKASHAYMDKLVATETARTAILIDVADKYTMDRYSDIIDAFLKNMRHVGIITDMQPSTLKASLKQRWETPILSHPFSPNQLKSFLHAVLDNDYDFGQVEQSNLIQVDTSYQGHILLVEDNSINQMVAGDMLEDMALTYDIAEDGREATEKISSGVHYDLVLMDIQMPIMDGYQATRKLRDLGYSDLIICGLSANAMKTDLDLAKQAGMDDYLTKPIEWAALNAVMAKYIDIKSA